MPTIEQLARQGHGFAVFPEVRIFDHPTNGKSIQHLIFGDFITPPKIPKETMSCGVKNWLRAPEKMPC